VTLLFAFYHYMQTASPTESTANQWHNRIIAQPAQNSLSTALKKAWHTTVNCFDGLHSCCTGEREETQDRDTPITHEGIRISPSTSAVATPSIKRDTEQRNEVITATTTANPAQIYFHPQIEPASQLTLGITQVGRPLEVDSSQTVNEDLAGAHAAPEGASERQDAPRSQATTTTTSSLASSTALSSRSAGTQGSWHPVDQDPRLMFVGRVFIDGFDQHNVPLPDPGENLSISSDGDSVRSEV
jgi:hypothetical protein